MEPLKRTRAIARNGLLGLLAAAGCATAGTAVQHARTGIERSWQDIESRIQYNYFTENAGALNNLRQQLSTATAGDKLRSYYGALLAYRLTQLSLRAEPRDKPDTGARELLASCVTSLDQVLEADNDFAEGLALQSACLGMAAGHDLWWRAPLNGVRSGSQLKRALQLAPDNPRVLLLQAAGDSSRGERTLTVLKRAIVGFEAERRDVDHVPAWGAAEAYVLEARIYLKRGDAVTARDALERALLLAPDYAQARRLLLQITS